jgi:hypothetical protein
MLDGITRWLRRSIKLDAPTYQTVNMTFRDRFIAAQHVSILANGVCIGTWMIARHSMNS